MSKQFLSLCATNVVRKLGTQTHVITLDLLRAAHATNPPAHHTVA